MGFGFDTSSEDIKLFLDEAEELLQAMEAGILQLEKEQGDPEVLQEIFRSAHTLKGSSATLGHQRMAELTHAMENVLDRLRKGKLEVSTELIDTLFACLDVLKVFKEEIATGEESGLSTAAILERLAAIGQEEGPAGKEAESRAEQSGAVSLGALPLTPEERLKAQEARARGMAVVWVEAALDRRAAMPGVRAFQALLAAGEIGEVIRSWPTQEEIEADNVGSELRILFATAEAPDAARAALESVPEIEIRECRLLEVEAAAGTEGAETPAEAGNEQAPQEEREAAEPAAGAPAVGAARGGSGGGNGGGNGGGGSPNRNRSAARTVRVDVDVLDNLMNLVGELVIERTRLAQVNMRLETELQADELAREMSSALAQVGRLTSNLQEQIQRARMLPVDTLFRKFPRMVRELAQKAGKEIEFTIKGEETELDRSVIEEIGDPLMHLLRNAVDHGIETAEERVRAGKPAKGQIVLEAFHEENHIIISVRDDGRGIDPARTRASAVRKGILSEEAARRLSDAEAINLIWAPGFSTAEKVSEVSGRGVGLDVVHRNIEKLNGSVEIKSEVGKGTEFRVKLPLTLAIIRALQVRVQETTYCIPLGSVVETDRIPVSEVQTVRQRPVIVKRGEVIPLLWLVDAFGLERPEGGEEPEELSIVIVPVSGRQVGLVVDTLIGEGEVVIKTLGKFIGDIPGISGATILGNGDVAIILDISSLVSAVSTEASNLQLAAR